MSAKTDNLIEQVGPYSFTQPTSGQRLTADTLHLLDFMPPLDNDETVIDLGTGAGLILLMLAWKSPACRVTGVEIDPQAYALALENVAANNLNDRITIINKDLRETVNDYAQGSFGIVVSNPPYRKAGTGRQSPDIARETARAESTTLKELVSVSRHLAGSDGRVFYVFPVARLFEMLREGKAAGLCPRRIRFIHTKADSAATLFLIEFGESGTLTIEEPVMM